MRRLSAAARAYVIACFFGGAVALGWLVAHGPLLRMPVAQWLLALALATAAGMCQVFVVHQIRTTGLRSDHLTPAPILAALLLLPSPLLALVLVVAWIPEWIVFRRSWYIQLWNIAAYLIAGAISRALFFYLTGLDYVVDIAVLQLVHAGATLALIPCFLGIQTLLLAWVFLLARNMSFKTSGLFAPEKLVVEATITCVGLGFAVAWLIDPRYGIATALPLFLLFQVLHVQNLREEAATDPKTGLANMRRLRTDLERFLERGERSGEPFSVLMCDLDYLRNINNSFGHAAGDAVLVGIADCLRRNIREQDVGARFGGEEFVVLLQGVDGKQALRRAEQIRQEVAACRVTVPHVQAPIQATISIGIASYPWDGRQAETLLHEADIAVYQAKRRGRDQVVAAGRQSRELAAEWAREHLVAVPSNADMQGAARSRMWRFIDDVTRNTASAEGRRTGQQAAGVATDRRAGQQDDGERGNERAAWLLVGLVVLGALLALVPDAGNRSMPWEALAAFVGVTALASLVAPGGDQKLRTAMMLIPVMSAGLLFGTAGVVGTGLTAALALRVRERGSVQQTLFRMGALLLAVRAAQGMFTLLVGPFGSQPTARIIGPAMLAGLACYGVYYLLASLLWAIKEQRQPLEFWSAEYTSVWPQYAGVGACAVLLAAVYQSFGWPTIALMAAPVAMMQIVLQKHGEQASAETNELRSLNRRLTDSCEATLAVLTQALDARDEETKKHSQRVRQYTQMIAQRMKLAGDELDDILRGALLHDIGKIGIPDAILLKDGRLLEAERRLVRQHPEIGYTMISHVPFLSQAALVVLHHHEAFNGSGYPSGLQGARIPLGARIFAVADAFDAMVSDRPYRKAQTTAQALQEIERCRGIQFDPEIVDVFLSISETELAAIQHQTEERLQTAAQIFEPLRMSA
ncbi:MAG: hypothetical protein NVSMB42_03740 [Herpetosiphon sp.]